MIISGLQQGWASRDRDTYAEARGQKTWKHHKHSIYNMPDTNLKMLGNSYNRSRGWNAESMRVDGCYRWTRCRPNLEPRLALNGGRKRKAAVITNTYISHRLR